MVNPMVYSIQYNGTVDRDLQPCLVEIISQKDRFGPATTLRILLMPPNGRASNAREKRSPPTPMLMMMTSSTSKDADVDIDIHTSVSSPTILPPPFLRPSTQAKCRQPHATGPGRKPKTLAPCKNNTPSSPRFVPRQQHTPRPHRHEIPPFSYNHQHIPMFPAPTHRISYILYQTEHNVIVLARYAIIPSSHCATVVESRCITHPTPTVLNTGTVAIAQYCTHVKYRAPLRFTHRLQHQQLYK